MRSRNLIVSKIIILSILAILLLGVMIFFIAFKWGFKKFVFSFGSFKESKLVLTENYEVNDISKLDFKLRNADIDIRYSDSDQIKLEVYDEKKDNFSVSLNDGVLKVDFDIYNTICIGFCFSDRKVIMYLPKEYDKLIEITSASGEVQLESFPNSNMSIKTVSGDVRLKGSNSVSVSTTSGEISLEDIKTINVKTVSGDINVRNVFDIEGSSISGDINVNSIGNSVNLKTTSGEIELKDVILNKDSKLSSVSGDIDIKGINRVYVSTSTISGDVDVYASDRMSLIELSINTTSGDITVK